MDIYNQTCVKNNSIKSKMKVLNDYQYIENSQRIKICNYRRNV